MNKRKARRMKNEDFVRYLLKQKNLANIAEVAQWFIAKPGCTPLKLQAMCYFTYVWGLVFFKQEVAPFRFSKMEIGPLDKRISDIFGTGDDPMYNCEKPDLDPKLESFLDFVWDRYRNYSGEALMERIRIHVPYRKAVRMLHPREMYVFYSEISSYI